MSLFLLLACPEDKASTLINGRAWRKHLTALGLLQAALVGTGVAGDGAPVEWEELARVA
jgi:hypothetical protein